MVPTLKVLAHLFSPLLSALPQGGDSDVTQCQQPGRRTKNSCRGSQALGANQETMNSKIDREKKINARKLLKLLKDKIYGRVHFSWLALQSTTLANWISCQNKLRIEPSLSLLLKLSREKVLEDKN